MSHQTLSVSHLPAAPFTVLRLDYLIICQGDYCAAKMLSLFEAWTESRLDALEQARYRNQAAVKEGSEPTQDESTWLYNTLDNIRERLLGEYSIKTINKTLKNLENLGFVKTRFDPKHKWNRTKQYQFQTQTVQSAIYQIAQEQLEEYGTPKAETLDFLHLVNLPNASGKFTKSKAQNYQIESAKLPNRIGKNTKTILKSHYKESLQNKHNRGACELNDGEDKESKSEQEQVETEDSWSTEPAAGFVAEQTAEESAMRHARASNSRRPRPRASPERGAPQPSARAPTSDFRLWTQEIEPREWEEFLTWKAEQAPATVSDPFGWAYNTLKADLERARLSLKSFRLQASQLPSGQGSEADGTLNFATWERARHVELAQQYLADTVAFLRQQPWHSSWVEYVNANFPDLFAEVYQGDR